ncbi:uroporphyrinogen-III synthase, partial [Salmonella enterica]|uniref:uroporphyrinogen-III synthase n=1 Tax=Salmonella enterica TaxID=28901 RepID=UPI003D2AD926
TLRGARRRPARSCDHGGADGPRLDAALFFSPRTAALFARLSRREGVADAVAGVRACCLSAAVAAEVRALPWAAVHVSAQPTAESLFELL